MNEGKIAPITCREPHCWSDDFSVVKGDRKRKARLVQERGRRGLLTTFATARAASSAKHAARQALLGLVCTGLILVAAVFASISVYHLLLAEFSVPIAAGIVAGGCAVIAVVMLIAVRARQSEPSPQDLLRDIGLPTHLPVKCAR